MREGREPARRSLDRRRRSHGVPEKRRDVVLGLTDRRLRVDRRPTGPTPKDVVVVKVAMDQARRPELETVQYLTSSPYKLRVLVRDFLEPPAAQIHDVAEWVLGGDGTP